MNKILPVLTAVMLFGAANASAAWLLIHVDERPASVEGMTSEMIEASLNEAGDIIAAFPDDFDGWGRMEKIPPSEGGGFIRVKVSDLKLEEARKLAAPIYTEEGIIIKARRGKVDMSKLPASADTYGEVETSLSATEGLVYDKLTASTISAEEVGN